MMTAGNDGIPQPILPGAQGWGPYGFPQLDPAMMQAMLQWMQQYEAAIQVSVDGMKFQYQLTKDDLLKVFSRYGHVTQIHVDEMGSSATITFRNVNEAQAAFSDLNGKVLNGLDGNLRIQWARLPGPPYPPFPGWPQNIQPSAEFPGALPPAATFAPVHAKTTSGKEKGTRKYTCRFIIGIENDKEFQVARRIIGGKGVNMKRIFRLTEAKLRLRGAGSGYCEGAGQKESAEPLQLCVSCTNLDKYKMAVEQVNELLKQVYNDYQQFCLENGKIPPDLQINLSENQLVYSARSAAVCGITSCPTSPGSPKRESGRSRPSQARRQVRMQGGVVSRGEPGPNAPSVEEIEKCIDERNEARRGCNFVLADRLRQLLHERGVALMDEPGGRGRGMEVTTWRYWRDEKQL